MKGYGRTAGVLEVARELMCGVVSGDGSRTAWARCSFPGVVGTKPSDESACEGTVTGDLADVVAARGSES